MYQIAKNKLNELYGAISAREDLFLPVQKAGQTNYGLWTEEAVVDIDTLKTVKSGKDCFFPQRRSTLSRAVMRAERSASTGRASESALCGLFGMRAAMCVR